MTDHLQALQFIAQWAYSLSLHLRQRWPVAGQGQPALGPPTNFDLSDLTEHLLRLRTLLFHFEPPADPATQFAWISTAGRLVSDPAITGALGRVKISVNRLAEQFGLKAAFDQVVDGQWGAFLRPTLNTARVWEPPGGRLPEIAQEDIRGLEWAAAQLFLMAGEAGRQTVQNAEVPSQPTEDSADAAGQPDGMAQSKRGQGGAHKGKRINERMMAILTDNPDSVNWTAEQWGQRLGCSKSTIAETRAWETALTARKLAEAERANRRKAAKPADRRRFGKKRSDQA
jgi:hypothetical protein